ncbi:transposable element Tcb1 transposase [Trichonephila clavipes]|nr:transposable element Tcb1 transposase [Trichonephila clavipes]
MLCGDVRTSGSEKCHLHEDKAQDALDRPVVKKTTTSVPVSSRTMRRRLAEEHLGSRSSLCVLPLMPTHRHLHLEWCRARGKWTAAEQNKFVFSNANPDSISAVMTIVFMCRYPVVNASILPLLYRDTPLPQLVCWYVGCHCAPPSIDPWHHDNPVIPIFVYNRAYLASFGMASWASHEFERTRGKVTANMERNVSKHHTELVYLNV